MPEINDPIESERQKKVNGIAIIFVFTITIIIFTLLFLQSQNNPNNNNTSQTSTESKISTSLNSDTSSTISSVSQSSEQSKATSQTTSANAYIYDYVLSEDRKNDYELYESSFLNAYIKKGARFSIPETDVVNKEVNGKFLKYSGITSAYLKDGDTSVEFAITDPIAKMSKEGCEGYINMNNRVHINFKFKTIDYSYYGRKCDTTTPTLIGVAKILNKDHKFVDKLGGIAYMQLEDNRVILLPLSDNKAYFDAENLLTLEKEVAYYFMVELLQRYEDEPKQDELKYKLVFNLKNNHKMLGGNGNIQSNFGDREYFIFKQGEEGNDGSVKVTLEFPREKILSLDYILEPYEIFYQSARRKK